MVSLSEVVPEFQIAFKSHVALKQMFSQLYRHNLLQFGLCCIEMSQTYPAEMRIAVKMQRSTTTCSWGGSKWRSSHKRHLEVKCEWPLVVWHHSPPLIPLHSGTGWPFKWNNLCNAKGDQLCCSLRSFEMFTSKHGLRGVIWVRTALHNQDLTFKSLNTFLFLSYFAVSYAHNPKRDATDWKYKIAHFFCGFHSDFPQRLKYWNLDLQATVDKMRQNEKANFSICNTSATSHAVVSHVFWTGLFFRFTVM